MSNCDVCIGVDTDNCGRPEFTVESTPKARKVHKCNECYGEIAIGSRYFKIVGKWDGKLDTYRQCMPCHEIQIVFSCGEGFLYGGLWEAWDDAQAFESLKVTSPCFNELSMEARAFLTARWWKWKESTETRTTG